MRIIWINWNLLSGEIAEVFNSKMGDSWSYHSTLDSWVGMLFEIKMSQDVSFWKYVYKLISTILPCHKEMQPLWTVSSLRSSPRQNIPLPSFERYCAHKISPLICYCEQDELSPHCLLSLFYCTHHWRLLITLSMYLPYVLFRPHYTIDCWYITVLQCTTK